MLERAIPILPGNDLSVAKDFYVGKLGFAVQYEATEDGRNGIMGLERGTAVAMKRPPMNEPWGGRTFGVEDPFGNTIFVIGPVTEGS